MEELERFVASMRENFIAGRPAQIEGGIHEYNGKRFGAFVRMSCGCELRAEPRNTLQEAWRDIMALGRDVRVAAKRVGLVGDFEMIQ